MLAHRLGRDTFGSYDVVGYASGALCAAAALMALMALMALVIRRRPVGRVGLAVTRSGGSAVRS
jgi:hypothetical protein